MADGAAAACGVRQPLPIAEVRTCAKVLALGAQNDDPAGRIRVERLEGVGQRPDEGEIEVIVRRPMQLNKGDEVVSDLYRNVAEDPLHLKTSTTKNERPGFRPAPHAEGR